MTLAGESPDMVEVICEDCREVQTTEIFEDPECIAGGSASLTATVGYESLTSATDSEADETKRGSALPSEY